MNKLSEVLENVLYNIITFIKKVKSFSFSGIEDFG